MKHVQHLCQLFDQYAHEIHDGNTVLLSILFHDIVYDATSQRNEEDSADMFREFVNEVNHEIMTEIAKTVIDYILATKSHSVDNIREMTGRCNPILNDKLLFIAFDMAILSSSPVEYAEYAKNIRFEYGHVDVETYCTRRATFLRGVLAGDSVLYGKLGDEAEARVKVNLSWEVEKLESGSIPS